MVPPCAVDTRTACENVVFPVMPSDRSSVPSSERSVTPVNAVVAPPGAPAVPLTICSVAPREMKMPSTPRTCARSCVVEPSTLILSSPAPPSIDPSKRPPESVIVSALPAMVTEPSTTLPPSRRRSFCDDPKLTPPLSVAPPRILTVLLRSAPSPRRSIALTAAALPTSAPLRSVTVCWAPPNARIALRLEPPVTRPDAEISTTPLLLLVVTEMPCELAATEAAVMVMAPAELLVLATRIPPWVVSVAVPLTSPPV